jgi:outer membrane protein assembly factor BamE (lipoprotein component of BamABCDE complex)
MQPKAIGPMLAMLIAVAGCGKTSKVVYVLEEPQNVTLVPSASATQVRRGETVILSLERRIEGKWKQVPLESVGTGQCWVYRPPTSVEPQAADSVEWEVTPEGAVSFNQDYRMDHTKVATMQRAGTITLKPRTAVKCEPDRVVEGPSLQIEVS